MLGFVWSSPFLRLMPAGADLKLTCGFFPAVTSSLPPGQAASASFAGCEMHTSAADAWPVNATAPAVSASAPAALRSALSKTEFRCFVFIPYPSR